MVPIVKHYVHSWSYLSDFYPRLAFCSFRSVLVTVALRRNVYSSYEFIKDDVIKRDVQSFGSLCFLMNIE